MTDITASFAPVAEEAPVLHGQDEPRHCAVLIMKKGSQPGEQFFVDRRLTIGRDPKSDIFLNDMTVSRSHAVIDCTESGATVKDSGSLNGTSVNGVILDEAVLHDRDVLQIGTFQMVFRAAGKDPK
ncbi:MAG: FHA domain-containing protein [Coriobacteriia bacterium]|nr:FHA domain-containing protein [Coriobacteriia bacterium]